jgi:nitrate reductase NapE component
MSKAIADFKNLSPVNRLLVAILGALGFALISVAERDIQRRPADEMRGPKLIWRLVSLNMLGAVGYLLWGRQTG